MSATVATRGRYTTSHDPDTLVTPASKIAAGAAALAVAAAAHWRRRARACSQADLDAYVAENLTDLATWQPEDENNVRTHTFVALAAAPPESAHPWYYHVCTVTVDEDDPDPLRSVRYAEGWSVTQRAAWREATLAEVTLGPPEPLDDLDTETFDH